MLESIVRQFLFHPTKLHEDEPLPSYAADAQEIWADADDGNRIHGLYWDAPADRPTILFFHGNAQSVYEWALIRQELSPLGCGLLLVDYPGYGKSSGKPSEDGLYAAGRAALSWLLDEAQIDLGTIIVFGKSLGGPVAAEVARGRAVRGLILESTWAKFSNVINTLIPMIPIGAILKGERYETGERMGEVHVPVLVIHGSRDGLIQPVEGKALYETANEPKDLYIVEGADHNDVSWVAGRGYGKRLGAWIDGLGE